MGIRYSLGGSTKTADRRFYLWQHPGGNDARDVPAGLKRSIGESKARALAREAAGGDWFLVTDDEARVVGAAPYDIRGDLMGTPARVDILNFGRTARSSFSVKSNSRGKWETRIDGERVMQGEFRPYYIAWQRDSSGDMRRSGKRRAPKRMSRGGRTGGWL